MNKSDWRNHFRQLLEINKADYDDEALNKIFNKHLAEFLKTQTGLWAGYSPMKHEPKLNSVSSLDWVFPVVHEGRLRWFQPGPKGFQAGSFSIQEPIMEGAKEFHVTDLSGVLIPGLGFDKSGVRLGWGKGFYDKAFSKISGKVKKVGVIWEAQFVERLPSEDHDLKVDLVITEKGIHQI